MFRVGDIVRHKATGLTGEVIGYGSRKVNNSHYLTTLKVKLRSDTPIAPIAEDVVKKWVCRERKILACTLPYFPKRSAEYTVA